MIVIRATGENEVPDGYLQVFSRSNLVMVPDEKTVVQIPITGSAFGASKNSVSLESGIVTEVGVQKWRAY